MLLPGYSTPESGVFLHQITKYHSNQVQSRVSQARSSIQEICKILQEILKEVESQEPRFVSSLNECNSKFEGLEVITPFEFEVVLYLNQMGVFNFVDDGTLPGCAVLKLSDGRKRSMSLWVEFITASGYLSAKKIRSRFTGLVSQICKEKYFSGDVKVLTDHVEVKLKIRDRWMVQITPAFKCSGVWPRSASQWPYNNLPIGDQNPRFWPYNDLVVEVKNEGFDLLSKDCAVRRGNKQSTLDGDAWLLSFSNAERRLIQGNGRRRCLSILKTLRDRHLDLPEDPVTNYHMKTLLMYECEKHPLEAEWDESCLGDRILGIFVQLISCLQCRKCPHYFLPALNLFKGKRASVLESASKQVWRVVRELVTNSRAFEAL
ncbi:protein mab-21-like [Cotesia glomerata]|uniref:protein mab-21-like n=1 Tax=Cotesia glomerata TaxID=32391 RepID=UPI001D00C5CE|nr:protein mab-21-like [Cotesia glomerata]